MPPRVPSAETLGEAAREAATELSRMISPSQTEGVFNSDAIIIEESKPVEVDGVVITTGKAQIATGETEYTRRVPKEITDPTRLIIVNGYGGIKEAYTDLDSAFNDKDRESISFKPIRRQGVKGLLDLSHWLNPLKLHAQGAWSVIRAINKEHGDQLYDVVGHSLGGPVSIDLALKHHDFIRHLVLLAPGGMGEYNPPMMAQRLPRFFSLELLPAIPELAERHGPEVALKELEYIMSNPLRTVSEAIAISSANKLNDLSRLRRLGTKVGLIAFREDNLFPLDELVRNTSKRVDKFVIYHKLLANHLAPQLDPVGVAETSLEIIDSFNESDKKAKAA